MSGVERSVNQIHSLVQGLHVQGIAFDGPDPGSHVFNLPEREFAGDDHAFIKQAL